MTLPRHETGWISGLLSTPKCQEDGRLTAQGAARGSLNYSLPIEAWVTTDHL